MDDGINLVAQGIEGYGRGSSPRQRIRYPGVIVGVGSHGARLAHKEILNARGIEKNVERSRQRAIHTGMKEMGKRSGDFFCEDAQGMRNIQPLEAALPHGREMFVRGRDQLGALQFVQELLGAIVCESKVGGKELLVQDRRPEKTRQLLLFDRVTRQHQHMADTGKRESGDSPFEWLEKSEFAVLKGKNRIALANLHTLFAGYRVDMLRIELQGIQGGENFARRMIGGAAQR